MERYYKGQDMPVMSRDEVRAFDWQAINELGVPGVVLMENAGRSCSELISEKLGDTGGTKVCIFCGTGNNGGDGYVIGRHLYNNGFEVDIVLCGDRKKIKGDALTNLEILEKQGLAIKSLELSAKSPFRDVHQYGSDADIIVDALFGTGLRGQLKTEYVQLIEDINMLGLPIVAVDIPSGLDCDTGEPLGAAIRAVSTVTFVAVKKGFIISAGAESYTGEIFVASIGVEPDLQSEL
jgi:NAD(P)H-hydrate epimerase